MIWVGKEKVREGAVRQLRKLRFPLVVLDIKVRHEDKFDKGNQLDM